MSVKRFSKQITFTATENQATPMELQLQTQPARYPVKSHVSGFRVLCEFARIFLFYRAFSRRSGRIRRENPTKNRIPEESSGTIHRSKVPALEDFPFESW